LCRCTGYIPIVEAALEARAHYAKRERSKQGSKAG
jgi:xanthine dehydrogenase iron-sulfur cluster and FAD-binding subunit A